MQLDKKWQYPLLLLFGLTVAFTACKNNDQPAPVPAPVLTVTGFSPATAPISGTVTITGTEFSSTPASNTVTFGGNAAATVVSATPTQLVVTVPANAQNGTITVTSGGKTATSTQTFTLGTRPTVEKTGNITANETWSVGNVYLLRGFVVVKAGATLTIEKGTLIKGGSKDQDPTGAQKGGTLVIEAGAKIIAAGTADAPIVFTSGKAAGQRNYGDWGGVVLIGKAPQNRPSSFGFEGDISGTVGAYSDAMDNSGTLQYVRIEFGGIALKAGSEINGLTMYGVGAGTTIDHIQVSYSGDDSYEWFGGTVNMKYLIAYRGFDDDWDTDWGYVGKVQYGVSLRDPNVADQSSSNGFESDNFANGTPANGLNDGLPLTAPVFANMSNFVFSGVPSNVPTTGGSGSYQAGMHLRRNTSISIFNSLLFGYPVGLRLGDPSDALMGSTYQNTTAGTLQLRGIILANTTTPVTGSGTTTAGTTPLTTDQATTFFNTPAFKNQIIATSDIAKLLLNADNFKLGAPNFLPQASSPLLTGASIWDGKGADAFFTKETFVGAFGTTDWTKGWANWDPQTTPYN